jgi:pyrimidine-specific ribonucleoside hydrolase
MSREVTPVVLDVDTGVDDACALLLAARHPGLDLRAVSCVAGNAEVDQVVANTLTVLDAAGGVEVPVARGAERPLLEPPRPARHVHGEDGMGDLVPAGWGRSARAADPRHAVELLRDVLEAALVAGERVTLVPLAPMTNIALLLRSYPQAARALERIVFMGGSSLAGNATAAAEFNVWHDPEAAAIVLDAAAAHGVPVTMYGLDVFYDVRITQGVAAELMASEVVSARMAGALVDFQCRRFGTEDATIGDAGAVCAVLDPGGLSTRRLPVRVELAGTWTRGQTVVDQRGAGPDLEHDPHGLPLATAEVALGVDAGRYVAHWLAAVTAPEAR